MPFLKCLAGRHCGADRTTRLRLYTAMIRPLLDYVCQILDGPVTKAIALINSVQNACLLIKLLLVHCELPLLYPCWSKAALLDLGTE